MGSDETAEATTGGPPVIDVFYGNGMVAWSYASALYLDPRATLDDLREAATTLEDAERIARRVLGGAHPIVGEYELTLRRSRAALAAREADDVSSLREAMEAMAPGDA